MNGLEIKPVFVNPLIPFHECQKVTVWHRVKSWAWNLMRRPLVRVRQRKLQRIALDMKADLVRDLLPKLYKNRLECPECVDAYLALNAEVFVSSIRLILTRMRCEEHRDWFNAFLNSHRAMFERSDSIAAWINGMPR